MSDTTDTTPAELLKAKESFAAPGTHVAVGDMFRADDPIVEGRRHLFEPVAATVRASVPGAPVSPPPFLDGEGDGEGDEGQGDADGAAAGDGEGQAEAGTTSGGKRGRKASEGA